MVHAFILKMFAWKPSLCYAYTMNLVPPVANHSTRLWQTGLFLLGLLLAIMTAAFLRWPNPVVDKDVQQERINVVVSPPQQNEQIAQTFFPQHNGLSEISVRIAAVDPQLNPNAGSTLALVDDEGKIIAERLLKNSQFSTSQTVTLAFAPENRSKGQPYQIVLSGGQHNQTAFQGYTLNTLPTGVLTGPNLNGAQTLYLRSRYTLQWSEALTGSLQKTRAWFSILLTAVLLIPLPGALLLTWRPPKWPLTVRWGVSWAAGIALWPLIWGALTLLGGRWTTTMLWVIILVGWVFWLLVNYRNGFSWTWRVPGTFKEPLALLLLLSIIFCLRLIAIRDVATLPWVDASRHALITTIMNSSGQMLTSYRPLLAVDFAPYHYGLHTLTAGVAILLPGAALTDILPAVMQLLSTIICLAVFSGSWLLTGRRSIGWLAAFLIGVPFFFPAYYTTWGRLTQLAGLIIMAVLLGITWRLRSRVHLFPRQVLFIALTAGLFFVHARVFMIFVPFWGLVMAHGLRFWRRPRTWKQVLTQWGWPLAAVSAICGPRLWALARSFPQLARIQTTRSTAQAFPTGYVTTGWEMGLWITAAALTAVMLLVWLRWRPVERAVHVTLFLAVWITVLALLMGGSYIHPRWPVWLPQVSLNSAYISLFTAEAIMLASGGWWLYKQIRHRFPLIHRALFLPLGAGFLLTTLFGVHYQAGILNDNTLLVQPSDLHGLTWINEHAPPEARIAHNSWLWLDNVWAGSDGGAWILPLTGRFSMTPPIDHIYNRDGFARTTAYNRAAKEIDDWGASEASVLLENFAITHIFVGVRSGELDPAELDANPNWKLVYQNGGTFIFEKTINNQPSMVN